MVDRIKAIGFTGTQKCMTRDQRAGFYQLFIRLAREHVEFHHGDCIGADAQAHDIVESISVLEELRVQMIIHPPTNPAKRAFKKGRVLLPKEWMDWNPDIVDASTIMIVTPKEYIEQIRSGTWATIRYARRSKKTCYVIWPDGTHDKRDKLWQ